MNKYQRIVIVFGLCIILIMLLFPPFHMTTGDGPVVNMGYSFIINPPSKKYNVDYVNVNEKLLIVQWIGVIIIILLAYFVLKSSKK